jgi:hypothetical protein
MLLFPILAAILSVVLTFVISFFEKRRSLRILKKVADEGYETACEILFPESPIVIGRTKMAPVV